jgi:hypothetical protein
MTTSMNGYYRWEQHDRSQEKLAALQASLDKQRREGEAEADKLRAQVQDLKNEVGLKVQEHNKK